MNLEIKINQTVTVVTTKEPVSGSFQGFTVLNQLPHLVLTTTSLEADKIVLVPVTQIVSINYDVKGIDRL
jgi:hypothetical protein